MHIEDLIEELQKLKELHGNLTVRMKGDLGYTTTIKKVTFEDWSPEYEGRFIYLHQ